MSPASQDHGRFPLFDGLRAIAAASVLVFHVAVIGGDNPLGRYGSGLGAGVQIFFAISGFLLYRPFVAARAGVGRDVRVSGYFKRRVFRIVPAYWVALTALAVTFGLPGVLSGDWWRYYGLVQIYDAQTFDQGMGVAWTLCIEATFYLVLPVYAMAMARWRPSLGAEIAALVALALAADAYHAVLVGAGDEALATTLPGTFMWFAAGMAIAAWSVGEQRRAQPGRAAAWVMRHPGLCWLAAVLVYALERNLDGRVGGELLWPVLLAVVAGLLVAPAVFVAPGGGGLPARVLRLRAVQWFGLVSYSVYLYHATLVPPLAERGAADWLPGSRFVSLLVAVGACTVVAATLSYHLVERPAQDLSRRRFAWPRLVRPQPAPSDS